MLPKSYTLQAGLDAARALYSGGDIEPLCTFIENHDLTVFSNRDYKYVNELTIKTIFLALLYRDEYYIMDSEDEIQRTYSDLIMLLRPQMRRFELNDILIEFKYLKILKLRTYAVVAIGFDRLLWEEV